MNSLDKMEDYDRLAEETAKLREQLAMFKAENNVQRNVINQWRNAAEAAEAKLAELEKQEPIYEYREIGESGWIKCDKAFYDTASKEPELDTRIVYARPLPAPNFRPYKAKKIGGSFQHHGTVVAEFTTTAGERRVVLEFAEPVSGMLHVYRPDQVEAI